MPKKIELDSEAQATYNELKKLSKRANQRIVRLERAYGKDSWAIKRLKGRLESEKIQAWTLSGRTKVNKSMTQMQMRATIKAINLFLESRTSTVSGVKQAKKKMVSDMQSRFKSEVKIDMSFKEAEDLYDLLFSDATSWIYKYLTPSEFEAVVQDAIEDNDSVEEWLSRLDRIIHYGNDLDQIEKARALYYQFVDKFSVEE